jgi:uncharacterized protein with HEPN domain
MSKALRAPDYLDHILQAIERIARYTAGMNEAEFVNSELVQDAVIRNIEIIGEASNNLQRVAPEFAARHNDIPWQIMYAMRNRVSHAYDKVDAEIVWKTVQEDLPALHTKVQSAQTDLLRDGPGDKIAP